MRGKIGLSVQDDFVKVDITNYVKGIYISADTAVRDGDKLIMKGTDLELVPHHTEVDIVGYFEDGLLFMKGVVSLSLPTQINIDIFNASSEKEERRNHLKVHTAFETQVVKVFSMGENRRYMRTNIPIKIRDLSLGGIGFYSNHPFFKKQRLQVNLDYLMPGFVAEFQVLRREKVVQRPDTKEKDRIDSKYRYGGRMLRLSAEQERIVCEYVFKVQLDDYHKQQALKEEWGEI